MGFNLFIKLYFLNLKIGNNVLIGSGVHITDHTHGETDKLRRLNQSSPAKMDLYSKGAVIVESNVWICDGVVIVAGVRIGHGAIIAANSVVTNSVPPNHLAAGVPAKIIKRLE